MSKRTTGLSDLLYRYLLDHSVREPEVLKRLREETATLPEAQMQIAPEQGQFMALLVRLMGARKTLEIGVFTGYSSTAVGLALPVGARLIACDVSEEYTKVARRYWQDAGLENKIELRLGPALQTLDALLAAGHTGTFDFVFIDADKEQYDAYYERSLQLVRKGGLIAVDNAFRGGRVADPAVTDPATQAVRKLNEKLLNDERIDLSLVPIGDGLSLARKR
jgi:predicted O-methyltransferase YrrM